MKEIVYNRPKGISSRIIQELNKYFKDNIPNLGRKYKIQYSYHCQGDFCKKYYEIIYLD